MMHVQQLYPFSYTLPSVHTRKKDSPLIYTILKGLTRARSIYIHSPLTLKDKKRRSYPEHEAAAYIFISRMITDTHGDNR
jgi:hypothetical protein